MKLYGVLVLLVTLSVAYGLKCYSCVLTNDPNGCTKVETCPPIADRCGTLDLNGYITKGCEISAACISPVKCCEGDLCNSAIPTGSSVLPTGSSVLLLLVSSAITSVFL